MDICGGWGREAIFSLKQEGGVSLPTVQKEETEVKQINSHVQGYTTSTGQISDWI